MRGWRFRELIATSEISTREDAAAWLDECVAAR
jgi:hypothetical protein